MLRIKDPPDRFENARTLSQMIVNTVREPLLVLDGDFKILCASASFHRSFQLDGEDTQDRQLFALDNGAWDIPVLRTLLENTLAQYDAVEGLEVVHDFARIGQRVLRIRAHRAPSDDTATAIVLLGFEDLTERRDRERETERLRKQADDLLQQKDILLAEMQHRVVNSLQIIAGILMLKARSVTSDEARRHLTDAHHRVMSVAAVQQHLHSHDRGNPIEIASYLAKLCASLAESMIGDTGQARLELVADQGSMASADIVSLGLITTELVINALKYAFPASKEAAAVMVRYQACGEDWTLSVSDNGVGKTEAMDAKPGLGTSLVNALARQLDAQVEIDSNSEGLRVSITHAAATHRAA